MKSVDIKTKDEIVPRFPYQLTEWFEKKEKLDCYLEPFVKYNDEDYGRIVFCPALGFAIFTKGQRCMPQV